MGRSWASSTRSSSASAHAPLVSTSARRPRKCSISSTTNSNCVHMRRDACYMKQAHIHEGMRRLHVRGCLVVVVVRHPCHALHVARPVQSVPMHVPIVGVFSTCSCGCAPMHA